MTLKLGIIFPRRALFSLVTLNTELGGVVYYLLFWLNELNINVKLQIITNKVPTLSPSIVENMHMALMTSVYVLSILDFCAMLIEYLIHNLIVGNSNVP